MDDLQAKIEALRSAGRPLHVETTAPLTDADMKILNRSRIEQIVLIMVLDLVLTAAPFIPIGAPWEYQVAASVGLFIVITSLLVWHWRRLNTAYRTIPKNIVRGIVTNKLQHKGTREVYYELTIGEALPRVVTKKEYLAYQVGDSVELHFWSGLDSVHVLKLAKWESGPNG